MFGRNKRTSRKNAKGKPAEIRLPAGLTKREQKQVKEIIERARKDDGVPRTAQQSIPFQRMFPDGICRVSDNYYTKTIHYQDINYQLAQDEDKTAIFEEWCSFLNFFDSSIHFELSFLNMATDAESFEQSIRIPFQKDAFNSVRSEYSQMLKTQLEQGNNGLTKTKYLTFGIEADSMRQAKPRLIHVQNDLLNNFRRLGVRAKALNGKERLQLMHDMFHLDECARHGNKSAAAKHTNLIMARKSSFLASLAISCRSCYFSLSLSSKESSVSSISGQSCGEFAQCRPGRVALDRAP